jgi:hypothetical protein
MQIIAKHDTNPECWQTILSTDGSMMTVPEHNTIANVCDCIKKT